MLFKKLKFCPNLAVEWVLRSQIFFIFFQKKLIHRHFNQMCKCIVFWFQKKLPFLPILAVEFENF